MGRTLFGPCIKTKLRTHQRVLVLYFYSFYVAIFKSINTLFSSISTIFAPLFYAALTQFLYYRTH